METPNNKENPQVKPEASNAEAPKKKKNIIRVFHAQNASDGGKGPRPKRPAGERKNGPGERRPLRRKRPEAAGAEKPEAAVNTGAEAKKSELSQNSPSPVQAKTATPAAENVRTAGEARSEKPVPAPSPEKTQAKPDSAPVPEAKTSAPEVKTPAHEAKTPASEAKAPASEVKAPAPEVKAPAPEAKPAQAAAQASKSAQAEETPDSVRTKASEGPRRDNTQARNNNANNNRGPRDNRDGGFRSNRDGGRDFRNNDRRTSDRSNNGSYNNGDRSDRNNGGRYNNGERSDRSNNGRPPFRQNDSNNRGGFRNNNFNNQNRTQEDRPQGDRQVRGDRPFRNNGQGGGFNRTGTDNRDNRFQGNNNRPGGRPQTRSNDAAFAADMRKNSKDSRRDRDREKEKEKNKKNIEKNQDKNSRGGRPNQDNNRFQNRIPRAFKKNTPAPKAEEKKQEIKEIVIPEKLTIRELADAMKMQPSVIVKKLFMQGMMVTVNHEIDFEKAQEIALEFDIVAELEEKVDVIEELLREDEEDESEMTPRPPVVCVMGHVDHGKTSLLDAIRKTNVTRGEAGGITQHIGASVVKINDERITFLDTPGHEAFTAMRMRGANSTDIAVLVVAADDGVMPQTVEAISHAKAAGVEIIVAINKIDKPSANIDRVKQEMSEYNLIPEDWGGSTVFVPVSAHTGEGIDTLLEMILLTAEVMELKANANRAARGLVIEAKLDKGKGPVATILVQKGTLHQGDFIAAGACSGKVRAMMDDKGRRVKEAGPSTPVEILGLNDVPNAGEVLMSFDNDKEAKNFAGAFVSENKNRLLEETKAKLSLDNLFDQIHASDLKELPIIVKADVQGSVEAVKQSLEKLSNEEVVVRVIHGGVGAINESDVTLAATSNAIIIGFNVRPDALAKQMADQENVDLRLYRVIYQAIEDVEAAMKGMLDPVYEEKVIGHAEIRQLFKASGVGTIAGSYVLDGIFQRNCKVRISREGEQIFEGDLASLKRFKDDVKEVKAGYECGLVFDGFNDLKEEDQIEAYIMVEVPRQ